ncbi:hypothetical protein [Nonomuraea guangzhouensis]|uniref:DUF4131 domain-containing protein n=1 Tax=Nonomuraea guangzhouensis TaxID=1291555 RepID=A0ABW4GYS1_9ACTN|nr:hypothetical protein [Nonomuraea guangzhouensis]
MAFSAAKAPRWWRVPALMAFAGWLFLAATYYLFIPIFHEIWLYIWLLIGFGWLWAGLWTFTAVIAYISITSYGRAFAGLVLAVVIGTFLWRTDWPIASVKSMIWLRQGAFADVAAAYERGQPVAVPAWMRSLAVDGEVQAQENGLYFQVFVDWRAESGVGFAYIPGTADSRRLLQTAAGDLGAPTRDLGNGWWWIE